MKTNPSTWSKSDRSLLARRLAPYGLLLLSLSIVLLSGVGELLKPAGQEIAEDGSQEIRGSTTVGQTFMAPFDGLYRIDVSLGTGGRANTKDLLFHLRTAPEATEDLASGIVNASTLKQDAWTAFEFPPLRDSGGRRFYFFLESPASQPGDTLSVFRSRQNNYRDGAYYLDGALAEGDLTFTIRCRPSPAGWLSGLLRLLARNKPSIWGQPACYGLLFGLYFLLLLLLLRRFVLLPSADATDLTGL